MPKLAQILQEYQQWLRDAFWQGAHRCGPRYAAIPMEDLRPGFYKTVDVLIAAVHADDPDILYQRWIEISMIRAAQNVPPEELHAAARLLRQGAYAVIERSYAGDPAAELAAIKQLEHFLHASAPGIAEGYVRYDAVVQSRLRSVVTELAVPVVPLYTGIVLLPLIGSIDPQRATQIMETLLEAIARELAEVAILDLTGVTAIDSQIAHHLLQTVRAVQLLGAEMVLVGISPALARTMVQHDLQLPNLALHANLAAGLEYALMRRGHSIE